MYFNIIMSYNNIILELSCLLNNRKITNYSFTKSNNNINLNYNNINIITLEVKYYSANIKTWQSYKTNIINSFVSKIKLISFASITNLAQTSTYNRPVLFGVSCGNGSDLLRSLNTCCSAGTLGCLISNSNIKYILSNSHVLVNFEPKILNNNKSSRINDIITQPGGYDSQCNSLLINNNKIANLYKWTPLYAGVRPAPLVDIAIATVDIRLNKVDLLGNILNIGLVKETNYLISKPVSINSQVRKSGRTTGLTSSKVILTNATISVNYSSCYNKNFNITYNNCFIIDNKNNFGGGGDSGSLIVDNATLPNPVGLLFAGSSTIIVAFTIKNVLATLDGMFKKPLGSTNIVGLKSKEIEEENKEENKEEINFNITREIDNANIKDLVGYGRSEDDEGEYIAILVSSNNNNLTRDVLNIDNKRTKYINIGSDVVKAF
jgi:hypothetical protein